MEQMPHPSTRQLSYDSRVLRVPRLPLLLLVCLLTASLATVALPSPDDLLAATGATADQSSLSDPDDDTPPPPTLSGCNCDLGLDRGCPGPPAPLQISTLEPPTISRPGESVPSRIDHPPLV